MKYEYEIIRSNRRTISLEITKEGSLLIRAPYNIAEQEIRKIVEEKTAWIEKNKSRMQKQKQDPVKKLTSQEIQTLADGAMKIIPERVAYYAKKMGVTYGRITLRMQKTRWGSCTGKGNLNFNVLLMLAPRAVLDYVVVHELCHRKEMNHSSRFWAEVEKVMPNYKEPMSWLKENGNRLMAAGGNR